MRRKRGEREVMSLIEEHLNRVEDSLQNMLLVIEEYLQGRIDSAETYASKTHIAESEADSIRREIADLLHRGAFLPIFREDVIEIVGMVDRIAGCARACCKFMINQCPDVPADLREDFLKIAIDSVASLSPLRDGVTKLSGDLSMARGKIVEVDRIEAIVDELESQLSRRIYSADLTLAHKMHLKQLVDVIVAISDIAQDAAEILETLVVKKQV